jgi:hypothetical protein
LKKSQPGDDSLIATTKVATGSALKGDRPDDGTVSGRHVERLQTAAAPLKGFCVHRSSHNYERIADTAPHCRLLIQVENELSIPRYYTSKNIGQSGYLKLLKAIKQVRHLKGRRAFFFRRELLKFISWWTT